MALADNLIAYWKMDETSGTNVDDAFSTNDGTTNNTPIWTTGKINNGLDFDDGSSEYISMPSGLFNSDTQTVAFWFKPAQTGGGGTGDKKEYIWGTPFGGGDGNLMALLNNDANNFQIYFGGTLILGIPETDTDLPNWYKAGQWAYLVATVDSSGDNNLYAFSASGNGSYNTSTSWTKYNSPSMKVAATGDLDAGYYYDGMIDEMAIWTRVLSSAEATSLYNSGSGDQYPWAAGGTNAQINIGDAWKAVPAMQINIGDSWKAVASAQINIGDTWKTVF